MSSVTIIGLSGTNGAGKDAAGHTLALKHNYLFVSVTDLLREFLVCGTRLKLTVCMS
jgi:broad-specificity NMP kinase